MADTTASKLIVEVQGKGVNSTAASMGKLDDIIIKTGKDSKKASSSIDSTSSSSSKLAKAAKIAGGILAFTASAIGAVSVSAIKSAAAFEQQEIAITTMLKSATKAKKLLAELEAFGAATPFETTELIKSGKALLAYGVASENVLSTLKTIGDIASGVSAPIGDIAAIFGKARLAQNLYAEDLNQLHDRGIPASKELAKVLGVQETQIKKLASEGRITFSALEKAFKNLSNSGGQFAGMMEKQSKSLSGLWSTLISKVGQLSKDMGTKMMPSMKSLVRVMTIATESGGILASAFDSMGNIGAGAIKILSKAFIGLSRVANAVSGFFGEKEKESLKQRIRDMKFMAGLNVKMSTSDAIRAMQAKGMTEKAATLKSLLMQQLLVNQKLGDIADNNVKLEDELQKIKKDNNSELKKTNKATKDAILLQEKLKGKTTGKKGKKPEDQYKGAVEWLKKMAIAIDVVNKKNEGMNNAIAKVMGTVNSFADQIAGVFSSISSLVDAVAQRQIAALDAKMQKELEAAGVSEQTTKEQAQAEYNAAVATGNLLDIEEKRRALVKAEIEEKYQKKKAKLEYQAALNAWNFQMASAAASGAMAILNAVASGFRDGGIYGAIAFGAFATAAAATQIGAVAAAKPAAPSAQFGGSFIVPPGNPADSGSLNVNSGEKATIEKVADSGGGSKNDKMTLMIGEKQFEAYMVDTMNKIANSGKFQITRSNVVKTA